MKPVSENPKARKPRWLLEHTGGKCFYCGGQTFNHGRRWLRDWLFVDPGMEIVREHKTPTIRGGTDERANLVPACRGCNGNKGAFTFDEYRFARALRAGTLNYRFAFDPPIKVQRDWLCCHSAAFERDLIIHNIPTAAEAYRLRNGWARGPRARQQ